MTFFHVFLYASLCQKCYRKSVDLPFANYQFAKYGPDLWVDIPAWLCNIPVSMVTSNAQGWGCLWLSPACPVPCLRCRVSLTGGSLFCHPHGEPLQLLIPRGEASPHWAFKIFCFKEVFVQIISMLYLLGFLWLWPVVRCKWITVWL